MKTVLVTGGTVRLGRSICEHLARVGWRVLTSSHRPDAGADFAADLTDPSGAVRLYAAVLAHENGRPPDALVNNAARFTGDNDALWTLAFEAPCKLTTLMSTRESGCGCVINILDARECRPEDDPPTPGRNAAYCRAKRALASWTRKAALLYSATLRVNAVAPGPVLAPAGVREAAGETPVARPRPEDVARAVAFLLDARATTGCILPVDGGQGLL